MKQKFKMHVAYKKSFGTEAFHLFQSDMSQYGYVPVCETEVEVDIPDDFDPLAGQVATLKQQRAKVHAEFQARVNEIDDALAKLLCLDFVEVLDAV